MKEDGPEVQLKHIFVSIVSILGCGFKLLLLHYHNYMYLILHLFHLGLEHRDHSIRGKSLLQLVHRLGILQHLTIHHLRLKLIKVRLGEGR